MQKNNKIQKKELFFLTSLFVFFIFLSYKFSFVPLNNTENKLTYIATFIKNGGIPYKEISDNTPPFNYYIYLIAYKIFDMQPENGNLRFFTLIYVLFFILLIYMISRLMGGAAVAMLSSFFYVVFIYKNYYSGIYALPGLFCQFPLFLSLMFLIFIEKDYEKVDYFLSGFFLCVASYFVFSIKFIVFISAVYIYLQWKKRGDKVKYVIWFLSGFLFMDLLALLWAAKNSMLEKFFQSYFVYNFLSFFNGTNIIKNFKELFAFNYYLFFILIFIYGFYKSFFVKKINYNSLLFLISSVICIIALFQKSMNTGYYYLIVPFISLMLSLFLKDFIFLILKKKNK